jgi:hypothetical protein
MIPRSLMAAAVLAASALAAPPLTTIQDVLYKADGTKFNGILIISWNSFQAPDSSAVVTQSTTVRVVDGNLKVKLVPTTTSTPAGYYSVTYNSDGKNQFKETWAVPAATGPLRVRDVRVTTANDTTGGGGSGQTGGTTGPIEESDVVGLVADLGARPVKGPGYYTGRVAMINTAGALEAVTGDATECVRVDGSSGACGSQGPAFVDGDLPSGIVDGANRLFTLTSQPYPASSLSLYRNGLLQRMGLDYALNGNVVQFTGAATPQAGDNLLASYRLFGSTDTPQMYPAPQVLCSGTGAATNAAALTSIGTCTIPANLLLAGDRIEVRYDLEHQGATDGFSFEVHWGPAVVGHRDAASTETAATGTVGIGLVESGARLSAQSWGTVLPFASAVATSATDYVGGIVIDFQGRLAQGTGDTLTLSNFTVVRFP